MSKRILSLLIVMAILISVAPAVWAADSVVGTAEEPMHFRSVTLKESIAINFFVTRAYLEANNFEKVEFIVDDNVVQTITELPEGENGLAQFTFNKLTPAQMGNAVTIRYCFSDAEPVEKTTSVLDYCMDILEDEQEDVMLKTAVVDLINYGAATQQFVGLAEGETYVNANLGDYAALGTAQIPALENHTAIEEEQGGELVEWLAAGLNLKDSITLRLKFGADNVEGLVLKATCADKTWEVTEFEATTDGYYVYIVGLNPAQLRERLNFEFYNAQGEKVSQKLTYSVESYAYGAINDPEETIEMKTLAAALMCYGDSVTSWVNAGTISGQLTVREGVELPNTVLLTNGTIYKTVSVADDGKISCMLPAGEYQLVVDGFRSQVSNITVNKGANDLGQIALAQGLFTDMGWWQGGSVVENGNSATITMGEGDYGDGGQEIRVGNYITSATSWEISAHVAKGAVGRHGFSVGSTGDNGTVFFFLEGPYVGYYTWWTYRNPNAAPEEAWVLPDSVIAAMQSDAGYDISLVATDINGAGTGTLTFYVNNIAVVQVENFFVGGADSAHVAEGAKLNLSYAHLSLAIRGIGATATFSDYYYTLNGDYTKDNKVTGSVVKLDGTTLPESFVIENSLVQKTVTINADGSFETALPAGEYTVTINAAGYKQTVSTITVQSGDNNVGEIKLIQVLSGDMPWWQGGSVVENGSSATITMGEGDYGDGGQEIRIGEYVTTANSWRVTTHIAPGAVGRHGISVGANGSNGTVFFFLEGEWFGYYTWWTLLNPMGGAEEAWVLPEAARTAIQAEGGYDLTLVATNFNGEGTGWLTFYVNDIIIARVANDFVGAAGSPHIAEGAKLDLSNVHLNLAIRGIGATATFSDYSYSLNKETAPALPELNGDMQWWGGETVTQSGNSATISMGADANGDAGYEARVGDYIVDAISWKISAHIAPGAVGRHGFSVGTNGANGTVFFFLEGEWAGYYTWWTYLNPNATPEEAWVIPDAAKAAIRSDDGYYLTLEATNITGAGTGTLTFYVNNTVVAQVQNFFVGAGPHVAEGALLDLSYAHISLAVRGAGATATFSNYCVVTE